MRFSATEHSSRARKLAIATITAGRGERLNRLRLGLVLESTVVPAWQYELIELLVESQDASLSLIMLSDSSRSESDYIGRSKQFQWVERFERNRVNVLPDACASRNAAGLLEGIQQVRLQDEAIPGAPQSRPWDQAATALDVILALSDHTLIDRLSLTPTHGVWFFAHDYGQSSHGRRPSVGFLETIKRRPYIRSELRIRRSDESDDRIAYESYSGIEHTSHRRSRNAHLWKILHFVPRTLRQMSRLGGDAFFQRLSVGDSGDSRSQPSRGSRFSSLGLWHALIGYLWWRLLFKVRIRLFRERWVLMASNTENADHPGNFELIQPPPGRFWADPHIFSRGELTCVFFEDASIASRRGRISVMCLEENGNFSEARPIIEKPYHLSYPFIFEWNGEIFLVPESAEKRTVEVYRCTNFPYEWEYSHDMLTDTSAYDTTLFESEGMWWMFTVIRPQEGASSWDELHLFYSNSPVSQHWHAHESNPVISDVRRARPAGRVYRENGRIYRPSQNSSYRYGYALSINEVEVLTTTTYRERTVRTVEPAWSKAIQGVHSFSRNDDLVMMDGMYRSPVWISLLKACASRYRRETWRPVGNR